MGLTVPRGSANGFLLWGARVPRPARSMPSALPALPSDEAGTTPGFAGDLRLGRGGAGQGAGPVPGTPWLCRNSPDATLGRRPLQWRCPGTSDAVTRAEVRYQMSPAAARWLWAD